MVSFNNIQPYYKLPGTSVEVDPSQAGTPTNQKYALLIGHKLNAAPAVADVPIAIGSEADAKAAFGAGSMLAIMYRRFFALNRTQTVFCVPIAEVGAGTAATGTITIAGGSSLSGVLSLYIAGQKVSVSISQTDTSNQVASKVNAALNAAVDLPVTSTVTTNVVTLTAKWKGATGNDIRIEDSVLGVNGGEVQPGLGLIYPSGNTLAGGTGTPDLSGAVTNLGDAPYKFVANPFTDTGCLSALATEYGFGDSGRWGWMRQTYGQVWTAIRDTYANHMIAGPNRNYPVIYGLAIEPQSPSPVWEWAAAFTARAAQALTLDPARPLQTLGLDGILPAPRAYRFNKTQLNALAGVGLAIQGTDLDGVNSGVPTLLREQSMYQRNTLGQADNAYELATTLATLDEVLTRLRQRIGNRYPRVKLANDGTRLSAGQAAVTPAIIKGELIAQYGEMEADGLVENVAAFKSNLIVQRSSLDPNTLECLYPPDLINQLRRFNVRAAFRLQFAA